MTKLPSHWKSLPLKDIVITRKGKKPLKLLSQPFKDSIPYLDIDAIENHNFKQYADSLTTLISMDTDIFMVADGSRSGLVARGAIGAVGSTILCITPLVINFDFLYYYLQSKFEFLNKNTTGASIPHLNTKLLMAMSVPLPPPEEQELIARELRSKLDEYQNDFRDAKKELIKVNEYRRSVLEKAFSGELTQNWRVVNKSIAGKAMSDLKSINKAAILYNGSNLHFRIPEMWIITDAASICSKITDGEHSTPQRYQTGELLLSARNVRDGFIDYSNVDYISKEDLKKLRARCNPEINDVLIVSVGATIGRTSVVRENKKFALVRSVLLLKPLISGEYLMYCLQSPLLQDKIKESSKGVAQAHLYITETNLLPIPFASFEEQKEIVKLIKAHFSTADQIEEKTSVTLKKIDDLQRAIFQIAYSGQLVNAPTSANRTWFASFIESINSERLKFKAKFLAVAGDKKVESKKLRDMMSLRKSIIESLESAPNNEITVEDAWHQSQHYEKGDVENFYEELELLGRKNDSGKLVTWKFSNNQKNNVILKFK